MEGTMMDLFSKLTFLNPTHPCILFLSMPQTIQTLFGAFRFRVLTPQLILALKMLSWGLIKHKPKIFLANLHQSKILASTGKNGITVKQIFLSRLIPRVNFQA